ncbi:MAG: transposase, partial [Candidatus Komeilibacteria bacterium]
IHTFNDHHLLGKIKNEKMALSSCGYIVKKHCRQISSYHPGCALDSFVIMPNHLHLILIVKNGPVGPIHESALPEYGILNNSALSRRQMLICKIIGRFKMQSAKAINIIQGTTGHPVWQEKFYDHIIRNDESLENIREYIRTNPERWKQPK